MRITIRAMLFLGAILFAINAIIRAHDGREVGAVLCGAAATGLLLNAIFWKPRMKE